MWNYFLFSSEVFVCRYRKQIFFLRNIHNSRIVLHTKRWVSVCNCKQYHHNESFAYFLLIFFLFCLFASICCYMCTRFCCCLYVKAKRMHLKASITKWIYKSYHIYKIFVTTFIKRERKKAVQCHLFFRQNPLATFSFFFGV